MTRLLATVCLLLFLPLSALMAVEWTFMVYLDGDNNLEAAAVGDFLEMATVGSDTNVNIVVLFDRTPASSVASGYSIDYDDWSGTRRGLVSPGDVPDSSWGTAVTEANMGAGATLQGFVTWAVAAYPANRYMLVLWNHGGGWRDSTATVSDKTPLTKGVCWDESSSDDFLTTDEVAVALNSAGQALDVLGIDACLMAMMEVAYQMAPYASCLVGSEEVEPGDGWPYDTILGDLAATPLMATSVLCSTVVTRYGASYMGLETQSAVDLTKIDTLASALDTLAAACMAGSDWQAISDAQAAAPFFTYGSYRDLGAFLAGVTAGTADAAILTASVAAETAYADAVIANHSGPSNGATGLSIYLPGYLASVETDYNAGNLDFAADTQWDEFLISLSTASFYPGFETPIDVDFESGMPAGWSVVDGLNDSHTWYIESADDPYWQGLTTSWQGNFMLVDSDGAGAVDMDEQLISPAFDCASADQVILEYTHYFEDYSSGLHEYADVDVSTNGGTVWTRVARYEQGASADGAVSIDITAEAAGHVSVKIRWHYYNANFEWFWGVDNIRVYCDNRPDIGMTVPASMHEDDGTAAAAGTVTVSSILAGDLTFNLTSSNPTILSVPASVVITAGSLTADFDVTVTDNTDFNAAVNVTVTAQVVGYTSIQRSITVLEEDTDSDSMSDDWEVLYFGDLTQGRDDDFDIDGFTNYEEFIAHTDPSDAASHPIVKSNNGTKSGCLPGPGSALYGLMLILTGLGRRRHS